MKKEIFFTFILPAFLFIVVCVFTGCGGCFGCGGCGSCFRCGKEKPEINTDNVTEYINMQMSPKCGFLDCIGCDWLEGNDGGTYCGCTGCYSVGTDNQFIDPGDDIINTACGCGGCYATAYPTYDYDYEEGYYLTAKQSCGIFCI